jgi:hypothetical protein
MQLIRLNTPPASRRGSGMLVVLFDQLPERADVGERVPASPELGDSPITDPEPDHSNAGIAQLV